MRTDSNLPRGSAAVALALMCCALAAEAAAEAPASTLDCVVLPDAEADVGSATPGIITRVLVERGALVQAGQPLAELESSIERAELALSATRAELDADVALYTASAAYERRRLRRIETLHANHVVSSQERDKVDTETELAALRMRQASDRKRLARLELARAQAALDQRTVRSPFDGVVVQQYKVAGEFVDEQPLLRVARLHPLRVEVIVPNELFGSVLPGMRAKVQQQLPGSPPREATVRLIDPVGEPASGTFTVSMTLPNPKLSILAGTRCTASMVAGSAPGKPTTSAATAPTTQQAGVVQQATVSHGVSADRHPPLATTVAVPRGRRDRASRPTPPHDEPMAWLPATTFTALVDATRQPAPALPDIVPDTSSTLAPMRTCSRLGPLPSSSDAEALLAKLRAVGMRGLAVRASDTPKRGDLVVVTDVDVARLKTLGLVDVAAIHRGAHSGRVSLGIYRGKSSAGARLRQVDALGVSAEVLPLRPSVARRWWVHVDRTPEARPLPTALLAVGMEDAECPPVVTASR